MVNTRRDGRGECVASGLPSTRWLVLRDPESNVPSVRPRVRPYYVWRNRAVENFDLGFLVCALDCDPDRLTQTEIDLSLDHGTVLQINRGDIFWLKERAPHSQAIHPHVVLQEDVFNHSRIESTIVCALSSNLHLVKEPGNVVLDPGEGNLAKQSVVVVSQISAIPKSDLGQHIGRLSEARVKQILSGLRLQQKST